MNNISVSKIFALVEWRKRFFTIALLQLAASGSAASFNCIKAGIDLERVVCNHSDISRLDDRRGVLYRAALAENGGSVKVNQEQRRWLREHNLCGKADCIARAYESRVTELRDAPRISFEPEAWVAEREARIKAALEGKALYIHSETPSNTPFCHQVLKDLQTFEGIEVIAPDVIANGLDAQEIRTHIVDRCPNLYIGNAQKTPRKIVLYHVDIDNNPATGKEWVLGDHYVKRISPRWGDELLVKNRYTLIDENNCEESLGVVYVGASQRYAPETNPAGLALDTGIHGVLRYRGKYYVYDVIDEPKVDPFRLHEYLPRSDAKSICRIKEIRD